MSLLQACSLKKLIILKGTLTKQNFRTSETEFGPTYSNGPTYVVCFHVVVPHIKTVPHMKCVFM